jgi:type VI secretion system protein ImpK
MRLREIFTPLIAFALFWERSPTAQATFETLRSKVGQLLDEQRAAVKRFDVPLPDYQLACFAVAAWLDELVLRVTHGSNPQLYAGWKRSPLQVELYKTANAGEEFFDKLQTLAPDQKEIRELYFICLSLGFRGRYYDQAQDLVLARIKRELAEHLPEPFPDLLTLEKTREPITPEPYHAKAPTYAPPSRSLIPWIAASAVLLAALLAFWFFYRPQPNRGEIEALLRGFDCSQISLAGIEKRVVSLAGRVQSPSQRQSVREAVLRVKGIDGVRDNFTIMPKPFCEVVSLLAPIQKRSETQGFDIQIRPSKGCDATYYRNEDLTVDISADKPLQFVYVDYYVANREIVSHMLPNPEQPDNAIKGATMLTVGGANSKARWHIEPPFGTELVTVVASSQPLLRSRLVPERVDPYLAELRRVLNGDHAAGELAATYCFISTEDR